MVERMTTAERESSLNQPTAEGRAASRRDVVRLACIWIGIGFLANYMWEMLHMPLYAAMSNGWVRCAHAAASDVAILGFLYGVVAAAAARWLWFRDAIVPRGAALATIGGLTAVLVELRALAAGEWTYTDAMPLVPALGVGLSPVLQMMVIPLALAWLSRAVTRHAGERLLPPSATVPAHDKSGDPHRP
jgi:hypothetical protein